VLCVLQLLRFQAPQAQMGEGSNLYPGGDMRAKFQQDQCRGLNFHWPSSYQQTNIDRQTNICAHIFIDKEDRLTPKIRDNLVHFSLNELLKLKMIQNCLSKPNFEKLVKTRARKWDIRQLWQLWWNHKTSDERFFSQIFWIYFSR